MGGQWATGVMMGGQIDMMGQGWNHPNGSHGMYFEFTTQQPPPAPGLHPAEQAERERQPHGGQTLKEP